MPHLVAGCRWQIGNGMSVNLWTDIWLTQSIIYSIGIDSLNLRAPVSALIHNGKWRITNMFRENFPCLVDEIVSTRLPLSSLVDQLIWSFSVTGELRLKDALAYFKDYH